MNYKSLKYFKLNELKTIASGLKLNSNQSKNYLIKDIKNKLNPKLKYKIGKQLGQSGKEGTTYSVFSEDGSEYAMKTFRKTKASSTLIKEAQLQKIASSFNISPKVIEINTEAKYIVMEKMDKHLHDVMKKQNGELSETQQKQIIKLFKTLDKAKILHGDVNILNYMYKNKKLYIIDFGMSKEINSSLIKKLGTSNPNMDIMTLGFVLKLKELKCPPSSYSYLVTFLSKEQKNLFKL